MSKIHRFYVGEHIQLKKDFWVHDPALLWQWSKVLRFQEGQEFVLFDGLQTERLYRLVALAKTEAHVTMVTEMARNLPKRHVTLFWSLLKKDNNDHIVQKATELGVSNFVPLITDRTIKKEFNIERARKIAVEASEQCGRSNIPHVREPIHIEKALPEYHEKLQIFVCNQGSDDDIDLPDKVGLVVGPEGGWTDREMEIFVSNGYGHIGLSRFTLRAETAAIVAASKVL